MSPKTATTTIDLLRWGNYFSVGVNEIDREHRGLIQLLNRLDTDVRAGADREVLSTTLRHVVAEAEAHFQNEEGLMAARGYPELKSHKAEHDLLLAQVKEFAAEFDAGRAELSESMTTYLKDWLRNHLSITDRRLCRFLKTALRVS